MYECLEYVGGEDLCNGDESLFSKEQSGHTAELEQEEDEEDIEKICKGKSGIQKCLKCEEYVPLECLKTNHYFCCEAYARKAISDFCDKYYHPFQIKSTQRDNPEKGILAKVLYKCTHVDRSKQRGKADVRCVQYHNFTGCTAQILVRKQRCGRLAVRTCQLDHVTSTGIIAHATGGKIYAKYPKVKQQVEESVKEDIIKLGNVNAPTREIAEHVSKSSGQMFTTTDIRNRINKYNSEIHGDENDINDFFNDIIKDGGNVAAKYDENKRVRVLLVQTQTQFRRSLKPGQTFFYRHDYDYAYDS